MGQKVRGGVALSKRTYRRHATTRTIAACNAYPAAPKKAPHLDTIRSVLGTDGAVAGSLDVSPSQVSRSRGGQIPDMDNADLEQQREAPPEDDRVLPHHTLSAGQG